MDNLRQKTEDLISGANGILIQKISLAVMFAAIGCVLGRYETDKLSSMTDAPDYICALLYALFTVVCICFLVPKMTFKDTEDKEIISDRYYRIIIVLAVIAVFCSMDPNPLGFVISLIVRLFCGLSWNIGYFFYNKDFPLIVRICLCIADAAIFITVLHLIIHYTMKLIFREPEEETTAPAANPVSGESGTSAGIPSNAD
ncbi:MAG: hypothetical protein K6G22_04900 [Lachnospiraceae bacterium]|nr:hypothetical protein [Lachnospiraceae bacterium]